MPKSKKLQKQIEKKLETLHELLDQIEEVRAVDSDDPETWDPDTLYNLVENCKEVIQILEDQKIKDKYDERQSLLLGLQSKHDEFGQPLYEEGLCTLVDSYQEEEEESEDY